VQFKFWCWKPGKVPNKFIMENKMGTNVFPGMPVVLPYSIAGVDLGPGLYRAEDGTVRASLVGRLECHPEKLVENQTGFEDREIILMEKDSETSSPSSIQIKNETRMVACVVSETDRQASAVPAVGQDIIGRVVRLTTRYASVDIYVIEDSKKNRNLWLQDPFKGTLRVGDIWPVDVKDPPALISQAVRPGDLVRARIIGVGDASTGFLISLAAAEDPRLGVAHALCASSGCPLQPLSWNQMTCPTTGVCEPRKPAKPSTIS
jgi:exosome complex component CSL4